ncbi:MAG: hypothetical protein ACLQPH_10830 [Acidimicrobiales bacterium]
MSYSDEQWQIGIGLLNDPADEARLRSNVTQAGPAVTALLINLGVI